MEHSAEEMTARPGKLGVQSVDLPAALAFFHRTLAIFPNRAFASHSLCACACSAHRCSSPI